MSEEKESHTSAASSAVSMSEQEDEHRVLVKKIGKTTYRVTIHFSTTSLETMSDKIKRLIMNDCGKIS